MKKKIKKGTMKPKSKSMKPMMKMASFAVIGILALVLAGGNIVKAQGSNEFGGFLGFLYSLYSAQNAQNVPNVPSNDLVGASNYPQYLVPDFVNGFYASGSQIVDSSGNATLPGTLAVTGASTMTGVVTFNGGVVGVSTSTLTTQNVSATSTINHLVVTSTLDVTGATTLNGGLTMDSTKFTVADTTGNTGIAGTLNVVGASTLASVTVTTTLAVTGTSTFSGDVRASSLIQVGSVAAFTVTSTITAAQVCDNPTWTFTATTGTPKQTLPSTTTLFADCLSTNGDTKVIHIINASSVTSTILAVGAGGTMKSATSTTFGPSEQGLLVISRDATLTYKASLFNAGL